MANLTVPGVKIQEISTLPPSVAPVDTAVPVFVGYTEIAPTPAIKKISSMLEYQQYFGGPDLISVNVALSTTNQLTDSSVTISSPAPNYLMYYSVKSFYDNGGGECYIASAGTYQSSAPFADDTHMTTALDNLVSIEDEPTLIVLPDAINLSDTLYGTVYQHALQQCGDLKDRFTIVDAYPSGEKESTEIVFNTSDFGTALASHNGEFAVFQNTAGTQFAIWLQVGSGASPSSPLFTNIATANTLAVAIGATDTNTTIRDYIIANIGTLTGWSTSGMTFSSNGTNLVLKQSNFGTAVDMAAYKEDGSSGSIIGPSVTHAGIDGDDITAIRNALGNNNLKYGAAYYPRLKTVYSPSTSNTKITISGGHVGDFSPGSLASLIVSHGSIFKDTFVNQILAAVSLATADVPVVVGPAGAVAGIYASVDFNTGVWKAPANVSINSISGTTLNVGDDLQSLLNVDPVSGKSINAIRFFSGKGNLVWGARTLAGNDNDWRYVNVRRLLIFIEESCSKASGQFVFEPNTAQTWQRMKGMLDNFLTNLWRQGALAGAKPDDAFFVRVGLGTTMSADDILNGVMNVEIGVCPSRPAEFIVLKFSHKLQVS